MNSFPHIGLIAVITVITHMNAFHQTGLTQELGPQATDGALQPLVAPEALLSQRENVQGTQVHRVDYAISVINRNQRNQSMFATIRTGDHLKLPSLKWIDYTDYTDYSDYGDASDYAHYSNERIAGYWSQTFEPHLLPTDASLHFLSETLDLLTIEGRQP